MRTSLRRRRSASRLASRPVVGLALSALLLASLVVDLGGCKRIFKEKKREMVACDLVTDAELEHATGAKVASHKGAGESCDWTFEGGKVMSVHVAVLSPFAAKVIPQLGKPEAVAGLGDRAEWSGGFAPQLRVYQGDRVLHVMMIESAPTVTMHEGPTHVVEQKKNGAGGTTTLSTTEETFDFPEMKPKMIEIAKAALPRM